MTDRKARPIIMSADSINAISAGRKIQTRRVMKPQQEHQSGASWVRNGNWHAQCQDLLCRGAMDAVADPIRCPYGQPGDLLWVRETCQAEELLSDLHGVRFHADGALRVVADTREAGDKWFDLRAYGYRDICVGPEHPPKVVRSIHMPRWASRLTLRLTDVRVERVQHISEEDAWLEGVCTAAAMEYADDGSPDPVLAFRDLWDSINATRGYGWEANPWVWALTFEPIWANVDEALND